MSAAPATGSDASGPDRDGGPQLLPLRGAGPATLAGLVADAVAAARGDRSPPLVAVTCDVDPSITIDGDVDALRRILALLLRRAVAAASTMDPDSEVPPLREVVVTAVRTAAAVEIEVADSGPSSTGDSGWLRLAQVHAGARSGMTADVESLAARCGGTLEVAHCPEGGTAVTLRLPRRRSLGMAA